MRRIIHLVYDAATLTVHLLQLVSYSLPACTYIDVSGTRYSLGVRLTTGTFRTLPKVSTAVATHVYCSTTAALGILRRTHYCVISGTGMRHGDVLSTGTLLLWASEVLL